MENEVNTWLNVWRERGETKLEDTIKMVNEAESIAERIKISSESLLENDPLKELKKKQIQSLRELQTKKIDQITGHLLGVIKIAWTFK
jgi:hypothetical protein